jgi:hypothetical protein
MTPLEDKIAELSLAVERGEITAEAAKELAISSVIDAHTISNGLGAKTTPRSAAPTSEQPWGAGPAVTTGDLAYAIRHLTQEGLSREKAMETLLMGDSNVAPYRTAIDAMRSIDQTRADEKVRNEWLQSETGRDWQADQLRAQQAEKAKRVANDRLLIEASGLDTKDLTDDEILAVTTGKSNDEGANSLAANLAAATGSEAT